VGVWVTRNPERTNRAGLCCWLAVQLVILIGLQASGKSTFRRARFDATHVVVSKDDFASNHRPARRQEYLIREALRAERPVVVDNTNVRREDRVALIALAREFSVPALGYFLKSTLEESLRRNAERTGRARVPDVGLFSMRKVFVEPAWSEGFDELYAVEIVGDRAGEFVMSPIVSPKFRLEEGP
jgi:tRNA uridine 5-carbamoylmethylation protein Kti12